ncbi:capsule assembly Wzi family protein [Echinicola marina]|uniref:capsule assembly Wzi family protein n=1 Tax=Echinicola marina TaxID=2859768 RepID=UPI001CF6B45F|nr:capsule assembly Wzi family protein [Echinicola marina]
MLIFAQTANLNVPFLEDYLRRQQLMGSFDENYSFSVRPIKPEIDDLKGGSNNSSNLNNSLYGFNDHQLFANGKGLIKALPVLIKSQYNSNYSFGANNGSLIPNKGLQMLLSAGVYAEYGGLSIQFQPELITAQNLDFQGFPIEHWGSTWRVYYEWLNTADIPERFGTASYTKLFLGQSNIKYTYKGFSVGISSENLWWGPSKRNALLMSNNATGFLHASIKTEKPIPTQIGYFEGQILSGKLENSGYLPPESGYINQQTPLYIPKRDEDWRYLSGIIISYQPKWVPGLSVGYSSVSQMYHNDMGSFDDYLPIFNGEKGPKNIVNLDRDRRNQLSSGFFRWMSHGGLFEFYGEYGSNGNSSQFRNFLVNPDLNRAFTFGFTNLIPLKQEGAYFQISSEMTQTGQTVRDAIIAHNSWYTHPYVKHGYTNRGEVMGAGYGPGSNVIFLDFSWVKDYNKIGFQMERVVYNNDFYYKRFEEIKDWRRKYIDLVPSLLADWKIDNFILSSKFQYVNTLNYKWYLENNPNQYFVAGLDKTNFVAHLSLTYVFD